MKKSFLALAVAALAATSIASTASAATVYDKDGTSLAVYGRVQSVLYSDKVGTTFGSGDDADRNASVKTSGRLGLDMRSQIFGDVAAIGKLEWDAADADGKDTFKARDLWVGLDFAQGGIVKVGRFEPAMKYAISQTDIFDDWGCTGLAGNDDKREGVVQYQWSGMGFDFLASYVFAKKGEHVDGAYYSGFKADNPTDLSGRESVDMKYTVSFAAGYTSPDVVFGPIAVRVGYEKGEMSDKLGTNNFTASDTENGVTTTENYIYDSYDQYAIGLSWGSLDMGPYIGAMYHKRSFDITGLSDGATPTAKVAPNIDSSVTGYEFVVGYAFANGISVRTGYLTQQFEIADEKVKAKTVPVYANWQLNPQFNVWAEARFDAGTDDSNDDNGKNFADLAHDRDSLYHENVFSAGLRYQF